MGFFRHGALIERIASTVTSASTVTLTTSSLKYQTFTGSTAQTVKLPIATTMDSGQNFVIYNSSSAILTVKLSDGTTTLTTLQAATSKTLILQSNATSNGTWNVLRSGVTHGTATPTAIASAGAFGTATDLFAASDHTHAGVSTFVADANTPLTGAVQILTGSGITLTQSAQAITVKVAASGVTTDSPTFTGTITAANANFSGNIGVSGTISGFGCLPIGSIVAWSGGYFTDSANSSYTFILGTANTIAGANAYLNTFGIWVCDGTAPNDAASPVFNSSSRHLPNLTDSRFLMGSTLAGSIGGQNSTTISSSNLPLHTHASGTLS